MAEARAVAHPVRLRIIRLCKDDALTNKELAQRLAMSAGTTLHHVRTLVATGFLVEEEGRRGRRGTTEKPYRSTGKSWTLNVDDSPARASVERAMLGAAAAEVIDADLGGVIESTRMSFRLSPDALQELHDRLLALVADYGQREDPGGEPLAMLLLLHRRPQR